MKLARLPTFLPTYLPKYYAPPLDPFKDLALLANINYSIHKKENKDHMCEGGRRVHSFLTFFLSFFLSCMHLRKDIKNTAAFKCISLQTLEWT
jgi:hypothetical protein